MSIFNFDLEVSNYSNLHFFSGKSPLAFEQLAPLV